MPTELIAAIVGFLVAATGLIKVWTEVAKIKRDRLETKEARDRDSLEWHDRLLKAEFNITRLSDQNALTATTLDDLRDTCAALNTSVAKLDVSSQNLTEAVKELKRARMD